jgi:protein-L-isoaspartate(D-aspartate) O-methyltransferase
MNAAAERANQYMVDAFIADGALWSPALIAAFRATPRHRFLDRVFLYQARKQRWREVLTRDAGPEELPIVYSDRALITHLSSPQHGHPQVAISSSSQPSLMALMLEDLRLAVGQRILEIGAGTGYNAALMAHVVGPGRVTSVDVDRNVLSEAWDHLRAFPERDVRLHHADGRHGYRAGAPYDRIMVTAATPDLEPAWLEQLTPGGLLLAPLMLAPGLAYVVRGSVTQGVFDGRLLRTAYFMPLRCETETGRETDDEPALAGQPRAETAPWAFCFGRRRGRHGWLRFIQAVAFYAWLRGLQIHYASQDHGAVFGISDGSACCWFGQTEWSVRDGADRALGDRLWQAFRAAGAPWPTEFRVRARVGLMPERTGVREEFEHRGPRCCQLWTLIEPRDRPAGP